MFGIFNNALAEDAKIRAPSRTLRCDSATSAFFMAHYDPDRDWFLVKARGVGTVVLAGTSPTITLGTSASAASIFTYTPTTSLAVAAIDTISVTPDTMTWDGFKYIKLAKGTPYFLTNTTGGGTGIVEIVMFMFPQDSNQHK